MEFKLNDEKFQVDFPYGSLDICSDDTLGFRPYQLMVASIAGCSGSVFRKILVKQKIEIEALTLSADVKRNEAEANKIESIHLTYRIKGHNLNEKKLKKNLEIARRNCSMVRSVEESIKITESLELA